MDCNQLQFLLNKVISLFSSLAKPACGKTATGYVHYHHFLVEI